MPWKVLGRKWHLARKGFSPGKRIAWPAEVLEELLEQLADVCPEGQFLWNNQQVVHLLVREQREPWATVHTKLPAGVDLVLQGPRGAVTLDRIADLAAQRKIIRGTQRQPQRPRPDKNSASSPPTTSIAATSVRF